jgi:hypothetical protein
MARTSAMSPALARRRLDLFSHVIGSGAHLLVFGGIAALFLISPRLLHKWGFSYEDVGGNVLEKVHPGTWLLLLATLATALSRANPFSIVNDFMRPPALAIYLFAWAFLMFFTIIIRKGPFTPLIDTFFMPAMAFVLCRNLTNDDRRAVSLMLHLILCLNALLGLYEYLSGWRLTPFVAGTLLIEVDWRSTALLGHPLENAGLTGAYALMLGVGGGQDLPKLLRPAAMGLALVSLIAFGGRSALVLTLLLLSGVGAWKLAHFLRGGRTDLLQVGLICLAAPLAISVLVIAIDAGFFDQLLMRFVDDQGSAKARVIMLKLFNYISWEDLVFGPDQDLIGSLQRTEGIEYGIESFWIAFILTNGLAVAFMFFLALFGFSWQLAVYTRTSTLLLLIYFYLLASTSVSMSAKTCSFGMFVIMIMAMMRREPTAVLAPARGIAPPTRVRGLAVRLDP